jgi:hypothetical protein
MPFCSFVSSSFSSSSFPGSRSFSVSSLRAN